MPGKRGKLGLNHERVESMVKKLHTAGLFFAVAALLGQQRIGQAPFYKDRQNLLVYLDDSGNSHSVGTARGMGNSTLAHHS